MSDLHSTNRPSFRKSGRAGFSPPSATAPAAAPHIAVEISRAAFASNIQNLRNQAAPSKLCVVMKSDAYGHGLRSLVAVAAEAGADYIGICTNPEARCVREASRRIPVLRLRPALPEELDESLAMLDIEEQVGTLAAAESLNQRGMDLGRPVRVHINIDTGMGRSGFRTGAIDAIRAVCGMSGLRIVGIMTHLANADAVDLSSAEDQLERFAHVRRAIEAALPENVLTHTHNSAATIRLPESRGDLVRVGAACYGVRTSQAFENPSMLRPVMSISTRVLEVRTLPEGSSIGYGSLFETQRASRIATIPVGFGEGYPRALYNKGVVLINGQRCSVVGRVSLNITTIDITDLDGVEVGDEVVLVGSQRDDAITFEEVAERFDSVHTEINLMAGSMNERTYV